MEKNKKKSSYFGNRKNYVIIGTLIIIIGIILFSVGMGMIELGKKAKSRYETIGGSVLRKLSPEDEKNYEDAKNSVTFGYILEIVGVIISLIGLIFIIKPELYLFLKKENNQHQKY